MTPALTRIMFTDSGSIRRAGAFACFFLLLCLFYAITLNAGWAYDSVTWLGIVRTATFEAHLNLGHHNGLSHYQLTQVIIWCMYRAFGTFGPAYLIIHIGLQAFSSTMLCLITERIVRSVQGRHPGRVALLAATVFCLSPYASEVVVYKAAFHYALALALLLTLCWLCLNYLKTPRSGIAVIAALVYAASLFSLELSYVTPWWCLALILWHFCSGITTARATRTALIRFLLPQAVLLGILQVVNLIMRTDAGVSLLRRPITFFAIKPPLFVLHLLYGRFLPQGWRDAWRDAFCTYAGATLFYAALSFLAIVSYKRFGRLRSAGKVSVLAFAWLLPAVGLSALMWFPEKDFIYCDRYLYQMIPAAAILMSCGVAAIRNIAVRQLTGTLVMLLSAGCLVFNNYLWWHSAAVLDKVHAQARAMSGTTRVLLLNSPWSFNGAPMVFPGPTAGFAAIARELYNKPLPQPVDEVMSFNLRTPGDGANVRVVDDTTVLVTLNQPGGWVRGYDPAVSYETPRYRAELVGTNRYVLRLRAADLQLWYLAGDSLRMVDMAIRDRAQN